MKRILVASDTHGRNDHLREVIAQNPPFDLFIFCGDGEGLEQHAAQLLGPQCALFMVRGNNDYFSELPYDLTVPLGKYRAFVTHGHRYGAGLSCRRLAEEAASQDCALCFYGHTHRPDKERVDGVLCMNPGSLSYPRQFDRRPSYLLIEQDDAGELHFHQAYIEG